MTTVFVNLGMSLDGIIAGPNPGPQNPLGDRGSEIHAWIYEQHAFRRSQKLGTDGKTGPDNDRLERTIGRIGANIMGKRMFEEGAANWPEEAPFHCPVFVLTNEVRAPWERPGGTTFYFVNDGIESALARARDAAGRKDVRISGGRNVVLQYLHAGQVDELEIQLAPILMGDGLRLFDGIDTRVELAIVEAAHPPSVTHLRYAVKRKRSGKSESGNKSS
jgi:dihydrofolate reductase